MTLIIRRGVLIFVKINFHIYTYIYISINKKKNECITVKLKSIEKINK